MEQMETMNREVVLTLGDGITLARIPHPLKVYGCQYLVLVPGRPTLCLRGNRVGNVRRHCYTPPKRMHAHLHPAIRNFNDLEKEEWELALHNASLQLKTCEGYYAGKLVDVHNDFTQDCE